jgi:hypothetical protein
LDNLSRTKGNTSAEVFADRAYRSTEIEGDFEPAAYRSNRLKGTSNNAGFDA